MLDLKWWLSFWLLRNTFQHSELPEFQSSFSICQIADILSIFISTNIQHVLVRPNRTLNIEHSSSSIKVKSVTVNVLSERAATQTHTHTQETCSLGFLCTRYVHVNSKCDTKKSAYITHTKQRPQLACSCWHALALRSTARNGVCPVMKNRRMQSGFIVVKLEHRSAANSLAASYISQKQMMFILSMCVLEIASLPRGWGVVRGCFHCREALTPITVIRSMFLSSNYSFSLSLLTLDSLPAFAQRTQEDNGCMECLLIPRFRSGSLPPYHICQYSIVRVRRCFSRVWPISHTHTHTRTRTHSNTYVRVDMRSGEILAHARLVTRTFSSIWHGQSLVASLLPNGQADGRVCWFASVCVRVCVGVCAPNGDTKIVNWGANTDFHNPSRCGRSVGVMLDAVVTTFSVASQMRAWIVVQFRAFRVRMSCVQECVFVYVHFWPWVRVCMFVNRRETHKYLICLLLADDGAQQHCSKWRRTICFRECIACLGWVAVTASLCGCACKVFAKNTSLPICYTT